MSDTNVHYILSADKQAYLKVKYSLGSDETLASIIQYDIRGNIKDHVTMTKDEASLVIQCLIEFISE